MRKAVVCTSALLLLLLGCTMAVKPDIPMLAVEGTHSEVGFKIGSTFAHRIRDRVATDKKVQGLLEYIRTNEVGKAHFASLSAAARDAYPEYFEEIEGMAKGSEQDLDLLVLLNIRAEISLLKAKAEGSESPMADHCSDMMLHDDTHAIVVHNEDDAPGSEGYLVTARIHGSQRVSPEHTYTAYVMPGELATSAFGFNSYGFVFSQNALSSTAVQADGVGRNFVSRDLLNAKGIYEALAVVGRDGLALGHNYQLMDIARRAIVNVEVAPAARGDATRVAARSVVGALFHANAYHNLAELGVTEPDETSSVHREAAYRSLPVPTDLTSMLAVMGDHSDEAYPIFRRAHAPDTGYTIVTAAFDLDTKEVHLFTSNPRDEPDQYMTVPLLPQTGAAYLRQVSA